jgi:hypothetical protein
MDALKNFNIEKWWNLLVAAGVVITGAAAVPRFVPLVLMGIGLVFIGAGESANHPLWTDIKGPPLRKVHHHPWKPKPAGLILDAIGIALFGAGLFLLLAS